MQTIVSKYYGELTFSKTWAVAKGVHVGRLMNGAYAHIGGLPVTDKNDLIAAIPRGEALDEALDWFENRLTRATEAQLLPAKLVMYYPPDQSWRYVDTNQPVATVEDLYEALKGSPALDAALAWFFRQRQAGQASPGGPLQSGYGVDDRAIKILGEAQVEGATLHDLGKQLNVEPKALVDLMQALENDKIVSRHQKRYYMPRYAPQGSTVSVGAGEQDA